jgi:hypothetical protein
MFSSFVNCKLVEEDGAGREVAVYDARAVVMEVLGSLATGCHPRRAVPPACSDFGARAAAMPCITVHKFRVSVPDVSKSAEFQLTRTRKSAKE